jgi:hypothetical protein
MKKHNRSLDYVLLAMSELHKGKPVLAARLFASAYKEADFVDAMKILEASNSQAFKAEQVAATAKSRIKASDEFPFEDGHGEGELAADLGEDFEGDPLDEVEDVDLHVEASDDEDEDEDEDDDDAGETTPAPVTASPRKESSAAAMARVLSSMKRTVK